MMKALTITAPPEIESLRLIEKEKSLPSAGQVGIKITSIGLNRGDLLFCQNRYFIKPDAGSRLGFEAAGIVEALPVSGVSKFKLGDRVALCPMSFDVKTQGALAEYGVYNEASLIPSPDLLPDQHCGAIWMAYFTAWGGMIESGELRAGEHVVITAASSSVGIAAIQIANMVGAIPIATTTNQEKADILMEYGAAHVIVQTRDDEKNLEYAEQILKITEGLGSDLVFDAVAGPGSHGLVKASKRGGRIVIQGMLDRRPMDIHAGVLMKRLLTLKGYTVDQTLDNEAQKQRAITAIRKGFTEGHLKAVIAQRFSLNDFQNAFTTLAANKHIGKIIITPG
jgi:NADPH:quinone reductase-like Zn-dependent oxidoreductase